MVRRLSPLALVLPAFLSALVLFAAASPATYQKIAVRSDSSSKDSESSLSQKDREQLFDQVWTLIEDKYYDPTFHGVDWVLVRDVYRPRLDSVTTDAQFYSLLSQMVGELHDAHTRFETPLERKEREKEEKLSAGFEVRSIDGRVAVTNVEPASEAFRKGVEPGMILTRINGKPVEERLAELRASVAGSSSGRAEQLRVDRALLAGEPGSKLKAEFISPLGRRLRVTVELRFEPDKPMVTSQLLSSSWLYLKVSLWQPPAYDQFNAALQQNLSRRGVIVDLRGNPGGEAGEVLKVAALFFQNKQPFGSFINRSQKATPLLADPHGKQVYTGPVAILADVSSGSGSELFASVMQETHRAVVVGQTTCGCLLGIEHFKKLKGGGDLAISELNYISPSGRKVEGVGVVPDIEIPLSIEDLASGRDAVLVAAEARLTNIAGKFGSAVQVRPVILPHPTKIKRPQVTHAPGARPHKQR